MLVNDLSSPWLSVGSRQGVETDSARGSGSGHPRGYIGASEVWGSVLAVSGFEVPGLRVRLGVSVSGQVSSLVARRAWTCCACPLVATDGEM